MSRKPSFSVRKRKKVDPADAEEFLRRQERKALGEAPATSKHQDVATSQPLDDATPEDPNVIVRKRDGKRQRRTTVYLPPSLQERLAVYCARAKKKHSDVMTAALASHLESLGA